MKINRTEILSIYMAKLIIRLGVFVCCLMLYIYDKNMIIKFLKQPLFSTINFVHVLWFGFMLMMLRHLFPKEPFTMALMKSRETKFMPAEGYSRLELLEYVQDQNIKAWKVMLVWLLGNSVVGLLYAVKILDTADMLMLSVFYFLCDYICILFYCPFQSHIMKNKCCVNCRIYDWGHFMMFTPMMFIQDFYAVSLFLMACAVLVHWELLYARHPERFYQGANMHLQCSHCRDKTCQIKNILTKSNTKI